ncbi:uncharacterized protein LOC142982888 [Anticarsia gemmatalis]|uniref:uncharacterized protein LOC142982888 n=1 Tax=Anticarsia gemmatalis TaxID=129554 RepID=UPI003F763708
MPCVSLDNWSCRMIIGTLILFLAINPMSMKKVYRLHVQNVNLKNDNASGCDLHESVNRRERVRLYNPNWPQIYSPGTKCLWKFECPVGSCRLKCDNLGMPESNKCTVDMLLVSRTGNIEHDGGDAYCGSSRINVRSRGQMIAIALVSSMRSPGGRFTCTVSSVITKRRYRKG